jgi:hypothetical protein
MRKPLPLPDLEFLNTILKIDPTSPSGLRWKTNRRTHIKPGDIAGTNDGKKGWYVYITFNSNSKRYKTHRIVYFMVTKTDPGEYDVDHIDGNTSNNHIDNLRLATRSQNSSNRNKGKNNSSGFKGVYQFRNSSKWFAQIMCNYKTIYLGTFTTKEEAVNAYNEASIRLHKEFSRHKKNYDK